MDFHSNKRILHLKHYSTCVILILYSFQSLGQSQNKFISKSDFIDSLSLKTFNYFWELAEPENGQIPDRWPNETFSSIAATGFGLACYIIGVDKGYITREMAAKRVLNTLLFLKNSPKGNQSTGINGYKGFFYHFLQKGSGLRFKNVELSTIDTGLLMAGILSTLSYFEEDNPTENQIRSIAEELYLEVNWDWAMNKQKTMSMGWHPETGFIQNTWKGYNEGMILYILALGSPTHPIPEDSWSNWVSSYKWKNHLGYEYVNFGPLFGHQYSQMFIDFKGIQDSFMRQKGIDYFENSKRATLSNRKYCIINPGSFKYYSKSLWGLTACDGPGNANNTDNNIRFMDYSARGCGYGYIVDDGTISPTAVGGSIPFLPEICINTLYEMYKNHGDKIYSKYGFIDAFNFSIENIDGTTGWIDPDHLGIDQGPILIQLSNQQKGLIINLMKKNKYIVAGLKKAGFTGGWLSSK